MPSPSGPSGPPGRSIDEAAARRRFGDIADTCGGCRRCTDLCSVFPTLFDLLEGRDAGAMTPAEQDAAADGCLQCGRCLVGCPYGPGVHERAVDVAEAVRDLRAAGVASGRGTVRDRVGDRLLGRPDLVGRLATGPVGGLARPTLRSAAAFGRVQLELPTRRDRFSRWWSGRGPTGSTERSAPEVLVFPGCPVEYGEPGVGRALVGTCERVGATCGVSSAGCCGAPWLHSGDLARFRRTVRRTMSRLAAEMGDDTVVVVPEASCAEALARTAPQLLADPVVADVAARVRDPIEYLLGAGLAASAQGVGVGTRVVHHVSCRSSAGGAPVAELLGRLGAEVVLVAQCSGIGDAWGSRRSRSQEVAAGVAALVDHLGAGRPGSTDLVTSECRHTADALARASGRRVLHPLEVAERLSGGLSELPLAEPPEPL